MSKTMVFQKKNITDCLISRLSGDVSLHISDTKLPGFHIRYYPASRRAVFYPSYRVRFSGGRQRNFMLGVSGQMTAAQARFKALVCKQDVLDGRDPMQELRDRCIARNQEIIRTRFL